MGDGSHYVMATVLNPKEIFDRAADEGQRRLDQSLLALLATGFIAGFTIVFGSAAQALVHSAAYPHFGSFASVLGAMSFGLGVVLLIIGRAELFSENFFDPIATAFEGKEQHVFPRIVKLWSLTLILNLVGGALMIFVFSIEGTLPQIARDEITTLAVAIADRAPAATFARSVIGGALVALLSYLVIASQSMGLRAAMAYIVGVLLALGPFEHVVVSMLHIAFGLLVGAELSLVHLAKIGGIALAGNLVGGVGLVTLSHAAQALGEQDDAG